MERTIMRPEEVAEYTGISKETLKFWRQRGKGPAHFKLGRRVFYDRAAVDAYIDEQRRAAAAS
jgi:excisionase family DNA binding protein